MASKKISNETIQEPAPETTKKPAQFTKKQFLESKNLPYSKDVVAVVLEDGKLYSNEEAKSLVEEFLNRKVVD